MKKNSYGQSLISLAEKYNNKKSALSNLNVIPTNLKDCFILEPRRFGDHRGYFESITKEALKELGFQEVVQVNHSKSTKGTVRGLHFQTNPYSQAKCVCCMNGGVLDIVVDLRTNSPSYGQWTSVELTPENGRMLYVPRGFAHGFIALQENTLFEYYIDNKYMPSHEAGVIWNDKDINIPWDEIFKQYGIDHPTLSDKDQKHLTLKNSPKYFKEVL